MPSPDKEKDGEGESNSPTDWGEIFGDLVCHTSISHSEIPYLTIPQIKAYNKSIGKNVPIKIGMPNMFGSSTLSPTTSGELKTDSPPKLSQFMSFANVFN